MEVFTLYVGQGNLSVVVGEREAIIVDSHVPPSGDRNAEFVKAALPPIVASKNVVGLMLTGFDADHADPAGIAWVLRKYQPTWLMYPQYYKDSDTATEVFRIISDEQRRRKSTAKPLTRWSVRLDRIENRFYKDLSTEWDIEVFSPHPEDMNTSNNCSLVAKIVPKDGSGFSYLITGDTENDRWENINRIFGDKLRADVMAAPHHGASNASNSQTVSLVSPTVVLISAGVDNAFGHPHQDALGIYRGWNREVHSTHHGYSLRTRKGWFFYSTKAWSAKAKAA